MTYFREFSINFFIELYGMFRSRMSLKVLMVLVDSPAIWKMVDP